MDAEYGCGKSECNNTKANHRLDSLILVLRCSLTAKVKISLFMYSLPMKVISPKSLNQAICLELRIRRELLRARSNV